MNPLTRKKRFALRINKRYPLSRSIKGETRKAVVVKGYYNDVWLAKWLDDVFSGEVFINPDATWEEQAVVRMISRNEVLFSD